MLWYNAFQEYSTDFDDDEFRPLVIDTSDSVQPAMSEGEDDEMPPTSAKPANHKTPVGIISKKPAISAPFTPKTVTTQNYKTLMSANGNLDASSSSLALSHSNSVGSLKDYLESSGIEVPRNPRSRRNSVSSGCSSVDTRMTYNSQSGSDMTVVSHGHKGSAPSKTRRKSDRVG